jgi:hypothetical protein
MGDVKGCQHETTQDAVSADLKHVQFHIHMEFWEEG